MSIQSEINRLKQAVSDAFTAIGNKGGTVPTSKVIGNLATAINSIKSNPVLQSKTVSPSTSKQTVKPDSGYDGLSDVTVNAMKTATQATPNIGIDTATGLISSTATQTEGYVASGTKTSSMYLTTQGETFYTPQSSYQTIPARTYLTGAQVILGDSNLVSENIKKGVSIFSVNGSYEGGSTVQKASGKFTTDKDGNFTVSTGFQPDFVTVTLNQTSGNGVYFYTMTVPFIDYPDKTLAPCMWGYGSYTVYDIEMHRTNSGFNGYIVGWSSTWAQTKIANTTFDYIAYKITA